jgi:hypothetical protein
MIAYDDNDYDEEYGDEYEEIPELTDEQEGIYYMKTIDI